MNATNLFAVAVLIVSNADTTSTSSSQPLFGLGADVQVRFDGYGVPHIFAKTWPDAARVLGYLHASERLAQMDLYRRRASGTMAQIMGPGALESDTLMRQIGIQRTCEAYWKSAEVPEALRADIAAYCAGVNQKIKELGSAGLPPIFQAMGYQPTPWMPVDCLTFAKYMGWDQSGTMDDLWFGTMVEKFGVTAACELWPLERPYEIPIVERQADRAKIVPLTKTIEGNAADYLRLYARLSRLRLEGTRDVCGSNNWAVDGTKTASGKPMLCNDPHLGFSLPSLWYTATMSVKEERVAGVGFPGSPMIVIGHTQHHGWGVTNMQADAVDLFVEKIDPQDPSKYLHKGEWKTVERITESVPVRGEANRELVIERTVHGPIVSRDGQTIALQWTGQEVTGDAAALWSMSRAKDLPGFLKSLDQLQVPCMNVVYADASGHIAIHPAGALPIRTPGQGRIPLDGSSGENDWQGLIPRSQLPLAIDPESHYVASANNRPVPAAFPYYVGWMWDPSYRARRIQKMLTDAKGLTTASMAVIQNDVYDEAASRFVPILVSALKPNEIDDPVARECLSILKEWDFIADIDSKAPYLWQRWFATYRSAVWDDEWEVRQIPKEGGSWGFSGNNRREPMLEILEFMTREQPRSHWFDDRRTPKVETRDDILKSSFLDAVASMTTEMGTDSAKWIWGDKQHLQVRSLFGQPDLARRGGPVPGTDYTVNPGDTGGDLGGGACWRMIVDFGHPGKSLGVYPGGQSENPASPHYSDQMSLWETGKYVDLNLVGRPEELPAGTSVRSLQFTAMKN